MYAEISTSFHRLLFRKHLVVRSVSRNTGEKLRLRGFPSVQQSDGQTHMTETRIQHRECKQTQPFVLVGSKRRKYLFRNFIFHFTVSSPQCDAFKGPERNAASTTEKMVSDSNLHPRFSLLGL